MDTNPSDRKATLSPAKRALLAERLRGRATSDSRTAEIQPRAQQNHVPLSFAQQRLWLLEQFEPGTAAYNISRAFSFSGPLDLGALKNALNAIVARHESLRTAFTLVEGAPVQVIASALTLQLPVEDLTRLSGADQGRAVKRLATDDARRPFDLAELPLLRVRLLTRTDSAHLLLLTIHHIVSDIWSLELFVRELSSLYAAFAAGDAGSLRELPIQYADYAVWHRKAGERGDLQVQVSYWKEQLALAPSTLALPTDHPRPERLSSRGSHQTSRLPKELSGRLKAIGRQENATLSMVMLAAFNVLLSRYTNQHDILVGMPIAGRAQVQTEPLIGCFINTLVLRTDLSGRPTFRDLLKRVKDRTLAAYTHQEVPFELLVQELRPTRGLGHSPFFQVMLDVHTADALDSGAAGGWQTENLDFDRGSARADLLLFVSDEQDALECWLEYSTDLFAAETISRMLGHLEVLLRGIVDDPDTRISELPLLSESERQQVLVSWNQSRTDYPRDKGLAEVFESQAAQTPESIAVVFDGGQVTYGELNRRANQLARYLKKRGVGPECAVALLMTRSAEMIVALLAVLKAGAAYVPLDPGLPADRLAFMVRDSNVAVLLTQKRLCPEAPARSPLTVRVDTDSGAIALEDDSNPAPSARPDDLAYVMYTSGSTGTPKGVCVTQRGVVRLVRNTGYADFGPDQVFLQFAPITFDASTFEIWGALLNGARLEVMPPGPVSLTELADALRHRQITTLWLTAGLFQQMVDAQLDSLRGLRQLLAGGDVLSPRHVETVLHELTGCQVINGYGPTEGTTFSCAHRFGAGERFAGGVPIGRPIANTQAYILDQSLAPVPIGVAGSLYVSGDGLARGYLNDPELTAARFLAHPFSEQAGGRLYDTGDQARFRPDGAIEFLGRADNQVKIRGYRIEPAEIELALGRHPGVRECAVAARGDGAADKRLVAYIVAQPGESLETTDLRAFL
ncbi:MAG: amino acid adenylation domain-containing protein, partial [Acidobacteriota bacterium]